jgi:hypothetical protein
MRILLSLLATLVAGCTATSLDRHTVNQAMTTTELRYSLVLDALAIVASSQGVELPSFAVATDSLNTVSDSAKLDATTTLNAALRGFQSQLLSISGNRSPDCQWTLDPTATSNQIKAIHAACCWVLYPQCRGMDTQTAILEYYQVLDDMNRLNAWDWLGVGCKAEADKQQPCLVAHRGNCYVWVRPGGMKYLSDFTLILLDIATVDPGSLQNFATIKFKDLVVNPSRIYPTAGGQLGQPANNIIGVSTSTVTVNTFSGTIGGTITAPASGQVTFSGSTSGTTGQLTTAVVGTRTTTGTATLPYKLDPPTGRIVWLEPPVLRELPNRILTRSADGTTAADLIAPPNRESEPGEYNPPPQPTNAARILRSQ